MAGTQPVGVAYVNWVTETVAANQYTGVHPAYREARHRPGARGTRGGLGADQRDHLALYGE